MEEDNKNNEVKPAEVVPNTQEEEAISSNANDFEEVPVYQEVEPQKKKEARTDSYFDGGVLELIGWRILAILITTVTLGIAAPWAKCMLYSWEIKHTVYNGKRLKFVGTGGDLFVNMFKWLFFTIITLGIYLFFVPIRKMKWLISNIHFEDEKYVKEESFFDGKTIQLIGINLLTRLITFCSFGLLFPFATCIKIKWIKKHTIINRKKLVFDGNGFQLWGKYLLWCFLSIITFGIFTLWLPILMNKWETKHVHIKKVGEEEKKDKSILILIPIAIALTVGIVALFSFVILPNLSELNIGDDEFNLSTIFGKNQKGDYETRRQNGKYIEIYTRYAAGAITLDDVEEELEEEGIDILLITDETKQKVNDLLDRTEPSYENSRAIATTVTQKKTSITAGKYTLALGTYKGTMTQGVWDETTMTSKARYIDVELVLTEDTITLDGRTAGYRINGTELRWNGMDFKVLEATGNNKITYYAETCPVLTYQGY